MPFRLAWHEKALRRLHVRLRADRARLVSGARLPLRRRHLDLHRRDSRIGLACRRHRADGPAAGHRLLRAAVREISRWPAADQQCHAPARLGQLDPLQPRDLQHLGPLEHAGGRPPRAGGADGRCRAHRAFLDRLRHQAGAGGCDRSGHQSARPGATGCGRARRGAAPLRGRPQRRGAEDPERRTQFHRMVRERRALRATGARAVRLFAADALAADLAREPAAARSDLCRGLRALAGAPGRRARGKPARARRRLAADVHALPRARPDAEEPRGGVADGDVLLRRWRARRLPSGASGRARPGRCRPGDGRDDLRVAGRAHHAGMPGFVE